MSPFRNPVGSSRLFSFASASLRLCANPLRPRSVSPPSRSESFQVKPECRVTTYRVSSRFQVSPAILTPATMPSSARTTAKKQQQHQQPSILLPAQETLLPPASAPITSTSSQSTLAQPINSNTPVATFDFSFFIKNAKGTDIFRFLDAVSQTKEAQNLKLLFMRAVSEGKKLGYEQGYKKGKEDCLCDLDVDAAYTAAFEEGCCKGEEDEKWLWEMLRHTYNQRCMSQQPTPETILIGVQSELPYVPPMVSSSTQTAPPFLVDVNMQTSTAVDSPSPVLPVSHLDWAEDVTLLPIAPLLPTPSIPRQHAPRDFSGLRSSKSNPFSSLQHRSQCFSHYSHQSHCRRSRFNFSSFHSPHHKSYKPSRSHFYTKMDSHLNWESDPRLSDLSRSLKALGWIRAS